MPNASAPPPAPSSGASSGSSAASSACQPRCLWLQGLQRPILALLPPDEQDALSAFLGLCPYREGPLPTPGVLPLALLEKREQQGKPGKRRQNRRAADYVFWAPPALLDKGVPGKSPDLARFGLASQGQTAQPGQAADASFAAHSEPFLASALCLLGIVLAAQYCLEHNLVCLHAALVAPPASPAAQPARDNGAFLLLAPNRVGKSTLVAALLARGWTCLGDDLVGLELGPLCRADGTTEARTDFGAFAPALCCLGLPPRLRIPLPPQADPALADWVRRFSGVGDDRYLYLAPHTPGLLGPGERYRALGVVLLEREPGRSGRKGGKRRKARGQAVSGPETAPLAPCTAEICLEALLEATVLQQSEAIRALEATTALANAVPCWRLSLENMGQDCAALAGLADTLSGELAAGAADNKEPPVRGNPEPGAAGQEACGQEACVFVPAGELAVSAPGELSVRPHALADHAWRRMPGIAETRTASTLYLASDVSGRIVTLNRTGQAVWLFLEEAVTLQEMTALFMEAFPGVSAARIGRDVEDLLGDLLDAGMIVAAD